jgi:rhamnogalacturonan endolyase
LEKIYVDDLRHWQMPNSYDYQHARRTPIAEITKLTTGVMAGRYDCKYDYSAEYWKLGCWGHASDVNKVGAWIVLGSHEFFNDGPTKQDLTAASGINHLHFGLDHYNGPGVRVEAGEAWEKFFGPYLLYCNDNPAGGDACWADAQAQARVEQSAWPYAWLASQPAYLSAGQRGAVAGRLVINDALKPALNGVGAWVGVAQPPPDGNWQFESKHYQYWAKADAQGNFVIRHVRPGRYALYAFTDGVVGEYSTNNVIVTAGRTTELAGVVWNVPHPGGRLAWEIGVPDRTAGEFRHGTDYFHGYLWDDFGREFSNPLEYTVGRSRWATDWNYAQAQYRTAGEPAAGPWKWRIHFNLTNVPPGTATLTLAIASAQRATIGVFVNNEAQAFARVTPTVQGGNALLREGIHAKYCVESVSIPTGRLKTGDNIITLALAGNGSADGHVMYDYLSLELP